MPGNLDVIVAGGGRVGFQTAELLADQGHDVTIVERDADVVDAIADEWVATVIHGEAANPDILEQADVEGADVVAGLTGDTGLNLAVCLTARELSADVRTVARLDRADGGGYTRFVDSVVFPERAGARVAANEIVGDDVRSLADVTGDLDVMQIRIAEGAPAVGRTLSEIRLPAGALVISDADGERIARPETELVAGRRYVVAVESDVADEVMNLLRG
jgi:trk system potassium uptake protein TrkA